MARHGTDYSLPPVAPTSMRHVRERLASAELPQPSLAELATMTGLSRYQVLRGFEKSYGLTPHAWAVQLRVERARSLIARGETLSIAALMAGFADQSHMNRTFVRLLGFTPGRYRKAILQ
jgi:AraC-like DNA-binding protein